MKLLVCGDRHWVDHTMVELILRGFQAGNFHLIEGCAPGADTCAHDWGLENLGPDYHHHFPADWARYGRGAGPRRNQAMLDIGQPDLVVAFHNNLEASKGTKDMLTRAMGAGIPIYHVRRIGK